MVKVACARQDWKRATKRFKRSIKLAENDTTALRERLKSLVSAAGQRQAASIMNILYEAGAIIVAFPSVNPAASMSVAEIAMKAFELIFDKPERDDWRNAQKMAIKHLKVPSPLSIKDSCP